MYRLVIHVSTIEVKCDTQNVFENMSISNYNRYTMLLITKKFEDESSST
jgi:hypothetical protein